MKSNEHLGALVAHQSMFSPAKNGREIKLKNCLDVPVFKPAKTYLEDKFHEAA